MTELFCPLKKDMCDRIEIRRRWFGGPGGTTEITPNLGMCGKVFVECRGSRSNFILPECEIAKNVLRTLIPRDGVSHVVNYATIDFNTLALIIDGLEIRRITRGNLSQLPVEIKKTKHKKHKK